MDVEYLRMGILDLGIDFVYSTYLIFWNLYGLWITVDNLESEGYEFYIFEDGLWRMTLIKYINNVTDTWRWAKTTWMRLLGSVLGCRILELNGEMY